MKPTYNNEHIVQFVAIDKIPFVVYLTSTLSTGVSHAQLSGQSHLNG